MYKDKKQLTPGSSLLLLLLDANYAIGRLRDRGRLSSALYPEYTAHYAKQNLNRLIQRLKQKGWITYEHPHGKRIMKLTRKGQLEALFKKSCSATASKTWDGKWTIVSFDIPETARNTRNKLRTLLYQYGFKALQASVYISPHPITKTGFEYLKLTKLIDYIRIFRATHDESTTDLNKLFKHTTTL